LPVSLDFAVPLGLLATELVSTTLNRVAGVGRVEISLRTDAEGTLRLIVTQPTSQAGEAGTGMDQRIVNALLNQLDGKMSVSNGGSIVEVVMPFTEAVA
jgi:two-component sensor histidine kinase